MKTYNTLIKLMVLSIGFLNANSVFAADKCIQSYKPKSTIVSENSVSKQEFSIFEEVVAGLKAKPNSYPILTITNVLQKNIDTLLEQYNEVVSKIQSKGTDNELNFSLETTRVALNSFDEIAGKLQKELEKTKRHQAEIKELSVNLKSCIGNLRTCQANLKYSLEETDGHLEKAMILNNQLTAKLAELEEFKSSLDKKTGFFDEQHIDSIKFVLDSHIGTLKNYLLFLESSLKAYDQSIRTVVLLNQNLSDTKLKAATLQSMGAENLDALNLSEQKNKETQVKKSINKKNISEVAAVIEFQKEIDNSQTTEVGARLLNDLETMPTDVLESSFLRNIIQEVKSGNRISLKDYEQLADTIMKRNISLNNWRSKSIFINEVEHDISGKYKYKFNTNRNENVLVLETADIAVNLTLLYFLTVNPITKQEMINQQAWLDQKLSDRKIEIELRIKELKSARGINIFNSKINAEIKHLDKFLKEYTTFFKDKTLFIKLFQGLFYDGNKTEANQIKIVIHKNDQFSNGEEVFFPVNFLH